MVGDNGTTPACLRRLAGMQSVKRATGRDWRRDGRRGTESHRGESLERAGEREPVLAAKGADDAPRHQCQSLIKALAWKGESEKQKALLTRGRSWRYRCLALSLFFVYAYVLVFRVRSNYPLSVSHPNPSPFHPYRRAFPRTPWRPWRALLAALALSVLGRNEKTGVPTGQQQHALCLGLGRCPVLCMSAPAGGKRGRRDEGENRKKEKTRKTAAVLPAPRSGQVVCLFLCVFISPSVPRLSAGKHDGRLPLPFWAPEGSDRARESQRELAKPWLAVLLRRLTRVLGRWPAWARMDGQTRGIPLASASPSGHVCSPRRSSRTEGDWLSAALRTRDSALVRPRKGRPGTPSADSLKEVQLASSVGGLPGLGPGSAAPVQRQG